MKYDEQFLLKAAARLESEAQTIVFSTSAGYTLVVGLPAFIAEDVLHGFLVRQIGDMPIGAIAIGLGLVAMAVGIARGREKAFNLRVQVHQLLALVEIERNTHTSLATTNAATASPAQINQEV
jgi:hypothetical protein